MDGSRGKENVVAVEKLGPMKRVRHFPRWECGRWRSEKETHFAGLLGNEIRSMNGIALTVLIVRVAASAPMIVTLFFA